VRRDLDLHEVSEKTREQQMYQNQKREKSRARSKKGDGFVDHESTIKEEPSVGKQILGTRTSDAALEHSMH
jgi:hypothetical protein